MDLLLTAAQDLRYLLGRGYPRSVALTFVGNHYQLSKNMREILVRGVYPDPEAAGRRQRLLPVAEIAGRSVSVDGHNVLITLESARLGRTLIDCDDGLVRDTAGVHSSFRPTDLTGTVLELTLNYLSRCGVRSVVFLLEARLSGSGILAAQVGAVMSGLELIGRARTEPAVDAELAAFPGVVATSDSALIDQVKEPFDLAGNMIKDLMPEAALLSLSARDDNYLRPDRGRPR